jgi:hypothetical protein
MTDEEYAELESRFERLDPELAGHVIEGSSRAEN